MAQINQNDPHRFQWVSLPRPMTIIVKDDVTHSILRTYPDVTTIAATAMGFQFCNHAGEVFCEDHDYCELLDQAGR